MAVKIREFSKVDIQNKIDWINDPENNEYLHYDLPLEYEKTLKWYENKNQNRYDGVILFDKKPVGLIGLLNIDSVVRKAELYIIIGNTAYKSKGIARNAIFELLLLAFEEMNLNKIYLFTEKDNIAAQRLFEKSGFNKEGIHKDDTINKYGKLVDRLSYGYLKEDFKNRE